MPNAQAIRRLEKIDQIFDSSSQQPFKITPYKVSPSNYFQK